MRGGVKKKCFDFVTKKIKKKTSCINQHHFRQSTKNKDFYFAKMIYTVGPINEIIVHKLYQQKKQLIDNFFINFSKQIVKKKNIHYNN